MNKIISKTVTMMLAVMLMFGSITLSTDCTVNAASWGTPYQKADTIVSGETYVFFANISNNLSQSDPADRLLTADLWRPMNQNGTSTTDFVTDQYGTLWNDYNDLSEYEYVITEVSGDMNEGNQGYRIVQQKSGHYLDVTQDMQPTIHEGSNKRFKAGQEIRNFDGEIYPTLAYVCISDTPRTWYWDQSRGEFYTLYTSNLKSSGTAVTGMFTDDKEAGTVYAYQKDNKNYLVNWGGYAYIDYYDRDFVGYVDMGTADIQVSFHSNMKLYLCAVNAGTGYHENHKNNLAEALHNPLYYFYKTYSWMGSGGCASLSVNNVGFIYGNFPDGGSHAEKQKVALYRKTASCSLEVICGNGSGDRPRGVAIDISANENTRDDHFVKWKVVSGDCVIENPEDRNTKITINSDTAKIEAVFEPHSYVDDHDCSTALYCTVCGDLLASISNHLFDEYTNPSPGFHEKKCEWCNVSIDYGACTYNNDIYPATCNSAKRCYICGAEEPGGEKDPDNHESEKTVWQQTETTHTLVHQCCGAVVDAETPHTWKNGNCTACGYNCLHKGGEATCVQKAVCEICRHPYGEIDSSNHAPASEWTQKDDKHYHICENGCGTHVDEAACSGGEASYFVKKVCDICKNQYGTIPVDTVDPAGEISVSENRWTRFLNQITFGLFFNDTQKVEITASDDSYGHEGYTEEKAAKIEYYLHTGETALTEADLESKEFTEYSGAFNIDPNNEYVVYARITDHAGNAVYISSDGIILDASAPSCPEVDTNGYNSGEWLTEGGVTLSVSGSEALSGIDRYQYSTDNGASWTDMTATNGSASLVVSDETDGTDYIFRAVSNSGVKSIATYPVTLKIDRTAPDGDIKFESNSVKEFIRNITFGLFFNKDIDVEITGTDDLSGVAEIQYYRSDKALTETEVIAVADWVETNGKFSVTAEDNEKFIYYVKITDNAGNTVCFGSDGATFDLTSPVISGVRDGNTYYATQSVTVSDENLSSVTVNGTETTAAAFTLTGDTDAAYTVIASDKAGNSTEYTVIMKPVSSLAEQLDDISSDNVTSDDKTDIEAVKEAAGADRDSATESENAALDQITEKCEELLEKLKSVEEDTHTENIQKVEEITSDTVQPEDREDLQAAKEDLEKALDDHESNLTDEERSGLEEKLEQINDALDSIEHSEKAEEAISDLPDTVQPDDTDTEQIISDAKEQYDALTDHEKSLVSDDAKEKLEKLLEDLVDYKIVMGDGSQWMKGSQKDVEFTANGAYSKFTGIEVDGEAVGEDNYTAASGSTVITLKPDYLETLSVGKHTLTVQYTDGEASCGFEIFAKDNAAAPGTGDNSNILSWIALLCVSGGILSAAAYRKKKQKN